MSFVNSDASELLDGRYSVLDIGTFANSRIVRCHDTIDDECVAVKVTNTFFDDDEINEKLVRASNEIEKLAAIRETRNGIGKNGIVSLKRIFYKDEFLCTVLEWLEEDLARYSARFDDLKLPLEKVSLIGKQLLEGLLFLSTVGGEFGITHGDIKLSNIMINSKSMEVKLVDFGSSFRPGKERALNLHKMFYKAPEVILRTPFLGAIDMWSTGCVLMELATGTNFFRGDTDYDLMKRMVEILGIPKPTALLNSPVRRTYFLTNGSVETPSLVFVDKNVGANNSLSQTLRQSIEAADDDFVSLVSWMLEFRPSKRIKPQEALDHPFIRRLKWDP